MGNNAYTIFEAVNGRRKEIFVGATPYPMFEAIDRLRRDWPDCLKHWDTGEIEICRSVEFHLTRQEAARFIGQQVQMKLPPGWKYLWQEPIMEAA